MSLISEAIEDRREQKRTEERLKREAVEAAKASMTFDARVQEDIEKIKNLLKDPGIKVIRCSIGENDIANVTRIINGSQLSEYKVSLDGNMITFESDYIDI